MVAAIDIAVRKKAKTFEYVNGILANWRKDGFKDIDKPWTESKHSPPAKKTAIEILRSKRGWQIDWKNEPKRF